MTIMVRCGSATADGETVEVRVSVSDGQAYGRRVAGSALMVPMASGQGYQPSGSALDCWLSGGVIAMLDECEARERAEAIDEIVRLARAAAAEAVRS